MKLITLLSTFALISELSLVQGRISSRDSISKPQPAKFPRQVTVEEIVQRHNNPLIKRQSSTVPCTVSKICSVAC